MFMLKFVILFVILFTFAHIFGRNIHFLLVTYNIIQLYKRIEFKSFLGFELVIIIYCKPLVLSLAGS